MHCAVWQQRACAAPCSRISSECTGAGGICRVSLHTLQAALLQYVLEAKTTVAADVAKFISGMNW
jgi:hypothetical protein